MLREDEIAGSAAAPQRIVYGRAFWLLFAATFALNSIGNLFVLFPLWVVKLGGGAGAIGAIVGTGSLAALAARPGVGGLIDRYGRRSTAFMFFALDGLAIALYLPVHALGVSIYVVRALHGAIEGTARVALFAMVYEMLPAGREGEAMATFSLCGMVPAALAPILGELLIRRAGFAVFFAVSVLIAIAGATTAYAIPNDRGQERQARVTLAEPRTAIRYGHLLSDRGLMPLWIVTLLFALALSSRLSFVAPFAYEQGVRRVGVYFAIYSVVAVLVRLGGGRIMDRLGLRTMVAPAMTVTAIGIALIAGTGHFPMLDLAAIIGGIGHGYAYPALSALVIARTHPGAIGRSSSIYTSLYDFGSMAGPYALGIMAAAAGYGWMFVMAGAFALMAGVYFVAVERGDEELEPA
jgi:MFS family permease